MSSKSLPILPGATLGILGGGQLGRMFTLAARTMGYKVMVLDPDFASPAGQMADVHLQADYTDHGALKQLGAACAAVTTEFENVPAASLIELANHCRVSPGAAAVAIAQDRSHEKSWLRDQGFATAPFALVNSEADLDAALAATGTPALLKVSRFGYDGKGQARVATLGRSARRVPRIRRPALRAGRLRQAGTRGVGGAGAQRRRRVRAVPGRREPPRKRHSRRLHRPRPGARPPRAEARDIAHAVAEKLGYVGVMAVEFFVADGRLMINEIAPRPHNSGHYTLDACVTDQFEQQVRVLCGLPLGDTRLLSPVAMVNILGDRWHDGGPHWDALLAHPAIKLHLYGKEAARPGRKMGHFNVLDADLSAALALAERMRDAL
jgi:5-(carboxyamino)imidazole ribonucleotide synthase